MEEAEFKAWVFGAVENLQTGLTLRTPSQYQSIFKYVALNTDASWEKLESTLNDFSLEGSTSIQLNDPFEASPAAFDDLDAHRVAAVTKHGQSIYRDITDKRTVDEVFADLEPYRAAAIKYLEETREHSRIVAFCERPDSGLLWSHYASSYQGACLHFLANAFEACQYYATFGYVNYSRHRPIYPLSLALALSPDPKSWVKIPYDSSLTKRAESDKVLFFTKASEWAYETELRLVYRPSKSHRSVKFEGRSLLSIIAGPRMEEGNKARLEDMVRKSALKQVVIRSARLSNTNFSVEID